jgi:ComF family protein
MTHQGCLGHFSLNGLISLYVYRSPLGKLIKEFKLGLVRELAPLLSCLAAQELRRTPIVSFWQKNNFIFTVVPLHQQKRRWRGFSQVEILAEQINHFLRLEFCPGILLRTRLTAPQAKLSPPKRKENIKGAFVVASQQLECVQERNILVFDDVLTSGATLKEAACELKKAGASQIWGLTIAA